MSGGRKGDTSDKGAALEAADWLVRRDAGLTAAEQEELENWLAADPKHREQFALHETAWKDFDLVAALRPADGAEPNPGLLAPRRPAMILVFRLSLAAAAVLALSFIGWKVWNRESHLSPAPALVSQFYERRVLEDGSVVELNRGAQVEVHFTSGERRVLLLRGEANFTVAKNPLRPFVVQAGPVGVRAVGTVFDVRIEAASVEVLVTEGHVWVKAPTSVQAPDVPLLGAGQRASVSLEATGQPPRIVNVSAAEVSQALAWRPRMLKFVAVPLSEVAQTFNQCNRVQLVIADPELRSIPVVASIRSDNVDGFVRLITIMAGVEAEYHGKDEIVLRRKH